MNKDRISFQQRIKNIKHGGVNSLLNKAFELGVRIDFIASEKSLIKLQFKNKILFIKKNIVPLKKMMGDMTKNKQLTKTLLEEINIKTPRGIVVTSYNEAVKLIKKKSLSYPLIIKPLSGSVATGVTWNINSKKEIKKAIDTVKKTRTFKKSGGIMVEEMFLGDEFRVLVFNGKVLSCVKKIPATIIGDGKSTIKQLVEEFNKNRMKGFEIKIDAIAKKTLSNDNLTLESILPNNFNLRLRNNLNMSDGGRCIEYTKNMDDYFKKVCEKAMESIGLPYGGIDIMAENISSKKSNYVILEINPNPYYNMHEKPLVEGKGIDVSYKILKNIFPNIKKNA